MSRNTAIAASALVLLALAGCGSAGGPASFVGSFDNEVVYIHWRPSSSGQMHGTATVNKLSGTAPTLTLSATTIPFTGTINGNSVSLTFGRPFGLTAHVRGKINGNILTLQLPQANGLIQVAGFTAGRLGTFNKEIATLRRQIQSFNARAAKHQSTVK